MSQVAARMRAKLEAALTPSLLEIDDDSAKHAGHAGARQGGESHFSVRLVSAAFAGKSRVDRQRLYHLVDADAKGH